MILENHYAWNELMADAIDNASVWAVFAKLKGAMKLESSIISLLTGTNDDFGLSITSPIKETASSTPFGNSKQ